MADRPIIAVANVKGGTGKTTTAAALADGMRRMGARVLAVDCDPQGDLSRIQAAYIAEGTCTTTDLIKGADVVPTAGGQATVPTTDELEYADSEPDPGTGRPLSYYALAEGIRRAMDAHGFDACVIDTHPEKNFPTTSALIAATHVLIPSEAEAFGVQGVVAMESYLDAIAEDLDKGWEGVGVVITKYRRTTTMHRRVADSVAAQLGAQGVRVFDQRISRTIQIPEAQAEGRSIYDESYLHGAAAQYMWLTQSVVEWAMGGDGEGAEGGGE